MRMRVSTGLGLALASGILLITQLPGSAATPNRLTEEEKAGGWTLLFDGESTKGWHTFKKEKVATKGWTVDDGWLHAAKGGGDILSDSEFEQFELQWEWRQPPGGNSGLKYFVLETRDSPLGHEYQIMDENPKASGADGKHATASFYDVLKPATKATTKPPGEVNHSRIVVKGNHVEHWLNGEKVVDADLAEAAKGGAHRWGAESPVYKLMAEQPRKDCPISLQNHNDAAWFRSLKIRRL